MRPKQKEICVPRSQRDLVRSVLPSVQPVEVSLSEQFHVPSATISVDRDCRRMGRKCGGTEIG